MSDEIEYAEELERLDEILAKLFYGTLKSDRVMVAVDLKMHIAIKMFARRRGWSIREAVHNLLAVGFETVIKNEYRKAHQSDKTIRGIPTQI
jgi:hypothetical protein